MRISRIILFGVVILFVVITGVAVFVLVSPTVQDYQPSVSIQDQNKEAEGAPKTTGEAPKETAPEISPIPFQPFGEVAVAPDFFLDGKGTNIDSPEFWEAPNLEETLLLVSGKGNDLVEVWQFPFQGKELAPLSLSSRPNGLEVDQDKDWLLIGNSEKKVIDVYTLPSREFIKSIGKGFLRSGETNLDILVLQNGKKRAYVSESHAIKAFDLNTNEQVQEFEPKVESIEELVTDSFYQVIYVPDESGVASRVNPRGAILAYRPDGEPFIKGGSNKFGVEGIFSGDAEGITLYTCLNDEGNDTGRGFIIVADQAGGSGNGFEFFDRETWKYLGTLQLSGVSGTDGIASTQKTLSSFPQGIFAATDADKRIALVGWEKIFAATKLSCR